MLATGHRHLCTLSDASTHEQDGGTCSRNALALGFAATTGGHSLTGYLFFSGARHSRAQCPWRPSCGMPHPWVQALSDVTTMNPRQRLLPFKESKKIMNAFGAINEM